MEAMGSNGWRTGGPLLGRTYLGERTGIMAKLVKLWEGLNSGYGGTYIRPHLDTATYSYGRWSHGLFGHWRFEHLGTTSSMAAAREALKAVDKAVDARAKRLNKRGRRARHG